MKKVLIACEFTGTVRNAFLEAGFDAWSCDLLRSEDGSNRHIVGDVREVLNDGWDLMMVAHPPCTRLCNSGVRWLTGAPPTKLSAEHYSAAEIEAYKKMSIDERHDFMWVKLDEGAKLFSELWNADIEHIAIENPVMHRYAKERIENYQHFAQSVQPWQFGDWERKRTCLWLKNLSSLIPDFSTLDIARSALGYGAEEKPVDRVHKASPGPDRWKERSRFFKGISNAMVAQWGDAIC